MWKFLQGRLIFVRVLLLCSVAALVAIGIAAIYSVGHPAQPSPTSGAGGLADLWKKQVLFAGVGCIGFLAANIVSYRRFGALSYWIYALVLVLLVVLILDKFVDIRIGNLVTIPLRKGTRR